MQTILVKWPRSHEYIEIIWNANEEPEEITGTKEWWKSTKSFVSYKTKSTARKGRMGWKITIHYEESDNTHIDPHDSYWGYSTLHISHGAESGKITWHDKYANAHNGDFTWTSISSGLFKRQTRVTVTKVEREQAYFRSILLDFETCCAITGETTKSALEAAHIIPSKDDGAEIVQNGLLLRADIHRLFDAESFRIDASGNIVGVKDDLSDEYKNLLKKKRKIEERTAERVREALIHREKEHKK